MKHIGNIDSRDNHPQAYLDQITEIKGYACASGNATLNLPACTSVGDASASGTATLNLPQALKTITNDGAYQLLRWHDGHYSAGCRHRLTTEQALAHWNRTDKRAVLFTQAIKKEEGCYP